MKINNINKVRILKTNISLYSPQNGEINRFLSSFYNKKIELPNDLKYNISFENPIEMIDLISVFIENNYKYKINMWINLDRDVYINVTEHNVDKIIRYIYERFPY